MTIEREPCSIPKLTDSQDNPFYDTGRNYRLTKGMGAFYARL